jgi:hypothetical protein
MSIQPALFALPAGAPRPNAAPAPIAEAAKARGAVFTRRSVVDFMLDLAGYVTSEPLHRRRLLEPSFGGGRFVLAGVERLLGAWRASEDAADDSMLDDAIRAVELDPESFDAFHSELARVLREHGLPQLSAQRLAKTWLARGDFLLDEVDGPFDFVVGNPPYVRQELLDPVLLAQYRSAYSTMVGRADVYVPFFERSLSLLAPGGRLCFICADAWTKNEYGRELRALVRRDFALRAYVDMYGVEAFEADVGAYPSITLIVREGQGGVRTARASSADAEHLGEILHGLAGPASSAAEVGNVAKLSPGGGPWLLRPDRRLDAIRAMEEACPALEEAGCRVGIGVATGADKVFIAPFAELDVEESRKLPLAKNSDVVDGALAWGGMGVVNPWDDAGGLVDLAEFPKLTRHLAPHRAKLAARHTARRDVDRLWYRTIDRITPALTREAKLLVPDIRGDGRAIAYDPGTVYPHHNLYHLTSTTWDLRALQAVLRSGIAHLFVEAYAVRIGGGYLRFQAQYLRRIRLPRWEGINEETRTALKAAGETGATVSPDVLDRVYGLDAGTLAFLAGER